MCGLWCVCVACGVVVCVGGAQCRLLLFAIFWLFLWSLRDVCRGCACVRVQVFTVGVTYESGSEGKFLRSFPEFEAFHAKVRRCGVD